MTLQFKHKLLALSIGLIILVESIIFISFYMISRKNIVDAVKVQMAPAADSFSYYVHERSKAFASQTAVAANTLNPDFRKITSYNLQSINKELDSEHAMLIDAKGRVLAHSNDKQLIKFPFPGLLNEIKSKNVSETNVIFNNNIYEVAIAKLPNEQIEICLVVLRRIDQNTLQLFKNTRTLPIEISIIGKTNSSEWQIYQSTLQAQSQAYFTKQLQNQNVDLMPSERSLIQNNYIILLNYFPTRENSNQLRVVLSYDLEKAFSPFIPMFLKVSGITIFVFIFALWISLRLAKSIAQPLESLRKAALKIEDGCYDQSIVVENRDEFGQLAIAFNTMMDGIAKREQALIFQSQHDELTELPNRRHLEMIINETVLSSPDNQFMLFMASISNVHEINYTLGHAIGDAYFIEASRRLKQYDQGDASLSRFNTDTFVLLLKCKSQADAEEIFNEIHSFFTEPYHIDDLYIDFILHAGICEYPSHGNICKNLLQHADIAKQLAREKHREGFEIYNDSLNPYNPKRLSLMRDLKESIAEDHFIIFYQPKIDIERNRIIEVEALIRWEHPKHGFMPPDSFIPLAEQTGNITMLTYWVLEAAIKQASIWHKQGLHLPISVNLSAKDLLDVNLANNIKALCEKYQVASSDISLEITENVVMEDYDTIIGLMNELNDMHFKLSIDDFGTGFSSLSYLKSLPVQELKIDKSFVLELATNESDAILVQSTIKMGHNMGLKIVAEGVEDGISLNKLKSFGCDLAQGYFFSKPLSADALAKWLDESEWGISDKDFQ